VTVATTVSGRASINSSDWHPADVRLDATFDYIRSETAVKPDPAWEHTDSNGHFHAFAQDGKTPTLVAYLVHIDCDGSCGGMCEGEGYDENHWKCAACGEEVEPRFVPDWDARTTGVPVLTRQWATVTVRGSGALPRTGHDNGDGTVTLTAEPSLVAVRVRTEEIELIGTGYAAFRMTYRGGRSEWEAAITCGMLLPRLTDPEPAARA
jgi:hypothetical protein